MNPRPRPKAAVLPTALASILLALAAPASAQIDCDSLPHWTSFQNPPQVNQVHIFCGEFSNSRPKGFHSRPDGENPDTVASFTITQPANAQGIYGGTWAYTGHPHQTKFSTMFPDSCTQEEVLNSVVYAAVNPTPCPPEAPAWAWCGPNRPEPVLPHTGPYCNADDESIFIVAGASLGNGNVNTAFPLMLAAAPITAHLY